MSDTPYSLRKSRKILEWSYRWYKKKGKTLPDHQIAAFEADLEACDQAYLRGNREVASEFAHKIEDFTNAHFKKSPWEYAYELVAALIFALIIATVVRQMWFEPYEIPTGSMRPTFKEMDHLTVSKTQFGLNIPLRTKHFCFDPNLVQRTGVVIWSGDGVALRDTDATYFGVIPYKKRYIKRLIGKPGDTLYFYGGRIYGIDSHGQPIDELIHSPWMEKLEYIPFLTFEGDITVPSHDVIQFELMHQPIGRLSYTSKGDWLGEVFNGNAWVKDQPAMQKQTHTKIKTYTDFWGMRNYGMARIATKNELKQYHGLDLTGLEDGILYLEIIHNPSLTYPKPSLQHEHLRQGILLTPYTSVIPLQERHLKAIMDAMYTARFEVKGGRAQRYSIGERTSEAFNPLMSMVPNGTYEFYYGKADKVGWGGTTSALPPDHPLYSMDPANVQTLYNMGIEMNTLFEPTANNQLLYPHRYAYFRDGDLYLMGAPIFKKDDPVLQSFLARELKKESQSSESRPYIAFKDYGPPLKDGKYDVDFIHAFGLQIPAKNYLVLGDNHAMSADSRVFGFLPQENLQGVPDLIIWPPGSRWGHPNQKPYPLFTQPRLIVWGLAILIAAIWYWYHRHRLRQSVFKKL